MRCVAIGQHRWQHLYLSVPTVVAVVTRDEGGSQSIQHMTCFVQILKRIEDSATSQVRAYTLSLNQLL